jgi:hypothetical protein
LVYGDVTTFQAAEDSSRNSLKELSVQRLSVQIEQVVHGSTALGACIDTSTTSLILIDGSPEVVLYPGDLY